MSTIDLHQHQPELSLPRRRRRMRSRAVWMAGALVALLAGGALIAVFSFGVGRTPAATQVAIVPDLLLTQTWDQSSNLHVLLPETQEVRSLLEGVQLAGRPTISADGQQVLISGWEETADSVTSVIYAFDSSTMNFQWRADLITEPIDPDGVRTSTSVAVVGDRVYVAGNRWQSSDPLMFVALDRASGSQVHASTVALGDYTSNVPVLYANADGTSLSLLFALWEGAPTNPAQAGIGYIHYQLPDLNEVSRQMPLPVDAGVLYGWGSTLAADGRTIYSLGFYESRTPELRFFDLESGQALPSLAIPFESTSGVFQRVVSADGERLYVFDPTSGEMAVVNLTTRAIEQQIVVDMSVAQGDAGSWLARAWGAVRGALLQDAGAKSSLDGSMQLSPDGTRLYAISVGWDAYHSYQGEPNGVMVIDTRTWQVVDRWLTDTQPYQLVLGGDGQYLYAQTMGSPNGGQPQFRVVDTTTGQDDLTADLPQGTVWSLAGLYRDTWGRAPEIAGVDAASIAKVSSGKVEPFASFEIAISKPSILAGDPVTVEARFVDPKSGEVVREGQDGVRFTPPDHVQATFNRGSDRTKDVQIVLTQAEYGVYRGAALLPAAGAWSLTVTSRTDGEPLRRVSEASAVVVQTALFGSDGNRYALRITTDPQKPVRDQQFAVHAEFVDTRTGASIPDGVTLPSGAPDTIRISLLPANGGGVTTDLLLPNGDGSYSGTAKVWLAGVWQINADFDGDGVAGSVPVEAVEVGGQ